MKLLLFDDKIVVKHKKVKRYLIGKDFEIMDKKLVNLYVPAVQQAFDLYVPTELDIHTLINLLSKGVEELCGGKFVPSSQELLTMKQPDMLFDPMRSLSDYGVEDGAQLILF